MADEYYDFDHQYNFRDRDALVIGPVAKKMSESFERFWANELAVPVEELLGDVKDHLTSRQINEVYAGLHAYAGDPENFAPEVRTAVTTFSARFNTLADGMSWGEVEFIHDLPGKNESDWLYGGGASTERLVELVRGAKQRVTIQTPYLILPEGGLELFRELVERGVSVRISTNSLASTDNLQAFSGYAKQRDAILEAGIEVYEFRPDPEVRAALGKRLEEMGHAPPVFALHAKTLVVDSATLFVGTFNLDPHSVHLNTEVGVLITAPELAARVEAAIETDMKPENSWNAREENPDGEVGVWKRFKVWFWKLWPLEPIL